MSGFLDQIKRSAARIRGRAAGQFSTLVIFVPIALFALLLAAYGWWWRVIADGIRQDAAAFQSAQIALGRELTWEALGVEGFPYRVQATLTRPHFTAPDHGAAWDGERVVMHVTPFALNRIGIALEGQQHFFYAKDGHWIETDGRADKLLARYDASGDTQGVDLNVEQLTGRAKVDTADFNFIVGEMAADFSIAAPSGGEPLVRIDVAARFKNAALQGNLDLPLGPSIASAEIDAGVKLPADMTETAPTALVAAWRSTGMPVDLRRFELDWGGIHVSVSGEFKLDAQSLPEGRFLLKLGNHPRILELLESYGWITKETHAAAKPVLDVLAFASGDPERRISVPLRIEGGNVYLGPARIATLQPPLP